jgi:hypothetical protein
MAKKLSPQINFGSFSFNSVASWWSWNLEIPVTYVGSQLPVCSVSSATSGVWTPSSQSTGIGTSKCIVPITSASSPWESFNLKVQVNGVSANINATLTVSAANNLPTGQNLTGLWLNASYSKHFEFDLSSYINDADWDTITINITNIQTNNGLVINWSVNWTRLIFDTVSWSWDITSIKYILNDWKWDSPEYTIDGVIGFFHY